MTLARYKLYTRKQGKPLRIMLLPPTDTNLYLHVRCAHLQMLFWKAADQQRPPDVPISVYGWKIADGITCPVIDSGPPGPPLLMNVICFRCRAKDMACKESNCSCYREKLSCTIYCLCTAGDECCNPFTKKVDMEENDDQHDHDYDDDYVDRDEL